MVALSTLSHIKSQTHALINAERSWVVTRIEWANDNLKEGDDRDGEGNS